MAKIALNDAATLQDLVEAVNANNTALEEFSDKVLSRDGTSPNAMEADLDMNGRRILNLPAPTLGTEPLRVQDAVDGVSVIVVPVSAYIATLVDDVDAAAARTTLGLQDLAVLDTVGSAQIDNDSVTNAKLANMAAATVKGRALGAGLGDPTDLTGAQVASIIQETGTFTPAITFGGAAVGVTYTNQNGNYVKIGNLVHIDIRITLSSKGSSVGNLVISGSPFTIPNDYNKPASFFGLALTAGVLDTHCTAFFTGSANGITIFKGTAGGTQLADTDLTNTSNIQISGTYRI